MPDTDSATEPGRRSMGAALRGIASNSLGLLAGHVQLFGIELQEEKERVAELAVLGACALVLFFMVLQLVTLLIVVALWDSYRLHALVGLALLYGGLGVIAVVMIRRKLDGHPDPFAATVGELEKDRDQLRP
jgi:uncharacterized membrane protein YqjE